MAFLLLSDLEKCGKAYVFDVDRPLGIVTHACGTGYYSFGHEVAHILGARHNQETGTFNQYFDFGYGYLIKEADGSASGYRTIMA